MYKGCVHSMSRYGPDRTDLALSQWNAVACSSILYGVECVVLPENVYEELERIQESFGREVLGVRSTSSGSGVLAELGLKPMRHRIYEQKLRFFQRISSPSFGEHRLARKALQELSSGAWSSDYLQDIFRIKTHTGAWRSNSPDDLEQEHLGADDEAAARLQDADEETGAGQLTTLLKTSFNYG